MMAQLLGWTLVLVVAAALVRALITGLINAIGNGSLVTVSRSKQPAAFWASFISGVLAIAFFVWLLSGADGAQP